MPDPASRITAWEPPQRPEWIAQFNRECGLLDLRDVVPLEREELIRTACTHTGLDHFGDDDWREPFSVLVKALDEEAELSPIGRILTRSDLLMFLEARLRVENLYLRHPEIDEQVIDRPLWVIGQGRSGTSLLHWLLSRPPANRTTTDGIAMFPVPLPGMSAAGQHELASQRITQWNRVTPEVVNIHEFGVDSPCETFRVEAMSFRAPAWLNLLGLTPSFNQYLAKQPDNHVLSLGYCKRVCKLLQWQRPGSKWVLRSNDSLLYLPEVFKVFPDATLVWSHRDPVRSLASMVDMIGTMMWIRSDRRVTAAYEAVTNPVLTSAMLAQPIDWMVSGAIPKDRLCNVQYQQLVSDPVGTIESVYRFCGMDFDTAARQSIVDYMEAHPRTRRPAHRYASGTPEQMRSERELFRRYQEYFGVPSES